MFRRSSGTAYLLALVRGGLFEEETSPHSGQLPGGVVGSGVASWYGHPYHGRKAANGETYDMDQCRGSSPALRRLEVKSRQRQKVESASRIGVRSSTDV
jgi:hypothetical protein